MKRMLVLGVLVGIGALSIAVAGQAPPGPSAKSIEATKIEKVKDNLYVITGSGVEDTDAFSGGNVAVFVTDSRRHPGGLEAARVRPHARRAGQVGDEQADHPHHQHPHARRPHRQQYVLRRQRRERRPRERQGQHGDDGRLQGRQRQAAAGPHLQGQADDRLGQGSDRHLLLRPRPHQRRQLRGVHRAAHDARRRHVRVEGAAVRRPRQRRQRRRAAEDAGARGGDGEERGHDHQRAHPRRHD